MEMLKIIGLVLLITLIIVLWIRYNPKLDLVATRDTYTLLLWYNKYDWLDDWVRTYIKIF